MISLLALPTDGKDSSPKVLFLFIYLFIYFLALICMQSIFQHPLKLWTPVLETIWQQ